MTAGDLSFAELAEHGDLGLGTLNHLDGEMVALDGEFFRADADGNVSLVPPYRPLTEVVADQHVFELADVEGTMLGFRFPAYVELPPQVDLEDPALAAQTHAAVEFVERG